jgi:superfamily II DNA or RNA helicase
MDSIELYDFQIQIVAEIERELKNHRSALLQSATGSGKTVIAGELIRRADDRGERSLLLAHREELITQTSEKLLRFGVDHGILKAGFPMRLGCSVQVASVQTLFARAIRGNRINLPRADWLFIDECHHTRAMTYMAIVEAYPGAKIIGMTATPVRHDGRGLGNVFDVMVQCPEIAWLIGHDYLVPAVVYAPVRPDLTGVRVQRGDYVESDLAERVDTNRLVGDVVEHWLRLGEGRPTVAFSVGVPHSRHIQREFGQAGVPCGHIDGTTPSDERRQILADLVSGKLKVVSNCNVLTEGWDAPVVSCGILGRPTKSLGLFRQMVGRLLRRAPGKTNALILDHAGGVFTHGLPDDKIYWTLSSDERAENRQHAARGTAPHAPALVTCPKCAAVRLEGRPCTVCGWRPQPPARAVVFADGVLGVVERSDRPPKPPEWTEDEKLLFYRELMGIAAARGYKGGWAAHKFSERFGCMPPWGWNRAQPLPPSAAVSAWVRARNIAYARSIGR